jgi:chromosome segregation ATPase
MDEAFDRLENKAVQVARLCAALRNENHQLRDRIGALEAEKAALEVRMTEARTRVEGLLDQLPPDA